jgi:hypothetical protein
MQLMMGSRSTSIRYADQLAAAQEIEARKRY